jgi:hypothetical protein
MATFRLASEARPPVPASPGRASTVVGEYTGVLLVVEKACHTDEAVVVVLLRRNTTARVEQNMVAKGGMVVVHNKQNTNRDSDTRNSQQQTAFLFGLQQAAHTHTD